SWSSSVRIVRAAFVLAFRVFARSAKKPNATAMSSDLPTSTSDDAGVAVRAISVKKTFSPIPVENSRHGLARNGDTAEIAVMSNSDPIPLLADLRALATRGLADALGIEVLELSPGRVVATMPVDQRTRQPFGILHGAA